MCARSAMHSLEHIVGDVAAVLSKALALAGVGAAPRLGLRGVPGAAGQAGVLQG